MKSILCMNRSRWGRIKPLWRSKLLQKSQKLESQISTMVAQTVTKYFWVSSIYSLRSNRFDLHSVLLAMPKSNCSGEIRLISPRSLSDCKFVRLYRSGFQVQSNGKGAHARRDLVAPAIQGARTVAIR